MYEKALEGGTFQSPIIHSRIQQSWKLEDAQWITYPGVKAYSSFKASIGFDIKATVEVSHQTLHNTVSVAAGMQRAPHENHNCVKSALC